jgi:hypothetical protein
MSGKKLLFRFSKAMSDSYLTWCEIGVVSDKPLVGSPALYSGRQQFKFLVRNLDVHLEVFFSGLSIWQIQKYCLQIDH